MERTITTQMSNSIAVKETGIVDFNPGGASLMEIREDVNRFPRLQSYAFADAVIQMTRIVSMAFFYRNQLAEKTQIQFIASTLVDELMQNSSHKLRLLTFAEIQIAVKKAVLETDMYVVSIGSLFKAILDFANGDGHINSNKYLTKMEKEQRELGEKRVKESGLGAMQQAYLGEFLKHNKIK